MRALLAALLAGLLAAGAHAAVSLPLSTSSRWIVDAAGARVKLRCVNWAGHLETQIPEGLNKRAVGDVAAFVAAQGFNCVRLTYAIDHALAPDTPVERAFADAADAAGVNATDMQAAYADVLRWNDWVGGATTREVFERVIQELWGNGVMVHLDNHVSRAKWCCNLDDGNGWWDEGFGYTDLNSRYFKTQDWLDGLEAMATWTASLDGVVSMGLRNEVRQLLLQGTLGGADDWADYMAQAARRVHAANPDLLVVIGGTQSSTDLTSVRLGTSTIDWSDWQGKHVWEWHAYSFTVTFALAGSSCDLKKDGYGLFDGFVLKQDEDYTAPLFLSEFGFSMAPDDVGDNDYGLSDDDWTYLSCLRDYVAGNDGDWAIWTLEGSYYVREGEVDHDEGFGLYNHDWSGLRNPNITQLLAPLFEVTQGP
ncbi:glycoside hydrolase family 5 protein [Xylariomycetidae sp. FL0641]|nr:glycoside hydrolase family 5 protein [Xylariomycetidae sp. FL0641]